jgi:hypothetical protein
MSGRHCLSTSMFSNYTAINHSVPFVNVAHELTVAFNNDRFLSFPVLLTKVPSYWWSMHINQLCTSHLSFQIIAVKLPITLPSMSSHSNFSVILLKFLQHTFTIMSDSPTTLDTSCRGQQIHLEKRRHCPCKVYDLPLYPPSQDITVAYIIVRDKLCLSHLKCSYYMCILSRHKVCKS